MGPGSVPPSTWMFLSGLRGHAVLLCIESCVTSHPSRRRSSSWHPPTGGCQWHPRLILSGKCEPSLCRIPSRSDHLLVLQRHDSRGTKNSTFGSGFGGARGTRGTKIGTLSRLLLRYGYERKHAIYSDGNEMPIRHG
jgi:hypothetical protein